MPLSNFAKDWLNALVLKPSAAPTVGANRFLALFTSTPTRLLPGAEPNGNGYVRFQVPENMISAAFSPGTIPDVTIRALMNDFVLAFSEPTGGWGTVTHIGLFDQVNSGNYLGFFDMVDFTPTIGLLPGIPVGSLMVEQGDLA